MFLPVTWNSSPCPSRNVTSSTVCSTCTSYQRRTHRPRRTHGAGAQRAEDGVDRLARRLVVLVLRVLGRGLVHGDLDDAAALVVRELLAEGHVRDPQVGLRDDLVLFTRRELQVPAQRESERVQCGRAMAYLRGAEGAAERGKNGRARLEGR